MQLKTSRCRRLLTVPWTARGSNQSVLKEINPEYSLERLMLKAEAPVSTLATWCGELTHWKMWELDHKEDWVPKNWCFQIVVLEKTLESLLDSKEIKPINPKGNQPWTFIGRTDAKAPILWATDNEEPTHWKRPWFREKLRAGGEGGNRGWDGWMASPTQWTWVWVNSGRYWRTGKPGMLQSMGLQSRAWLSTWITVKAEGVVKFEYHHLATRWNNRFRQ